MRKNVVYLTVCATTTILAASCVDIDKDDTAQKTAPEFVLIYVENQAGDYPTTQGVYKSAELIYEKIGGRMGIQINTGGVLRNGRTMIEQLQFGGMGSARVSLSPLIEFVPKLNVLQTSYLYTGQGHVWRVLERPVNTGFMNSFDGSNLVPLSWYNTGARNFYSTDRPIKSPDDIEGLRIRVQESELMMDTTQALGAVPVSMTFGDIYSGLQTREINGAEDNWLSYESVRHYEMAQYFTLDEHAGAPEPQLMTQFTWDKPPGECRDVIRDCAWESALYERKLWAKREKISEDRVRGAGCVMTELDAGEKGRFQEATAPMYEKCCSEYVDITDNIINAGRQRQDLGKI